MVHEQADAFQFERVAPEIHPEDWIPMHLECVLEDTNGAFPLHGTARYGSVQFTFGGFSTGYCTWYLVLF